MHPQHVAATLTQFVHLDLSRSMGVVSAGSLCAGARELPRGVNRQYNLIVIEHDFVNARVHVREMGEGEQFTRKRSGAFLDGFVKISWQPPTDISGAESDVQAANSRRATIDAEMALREGRTQDAVKLLSDADVSSPSYPRTLMIDALLDQRDWQSLSTLLQVPNNIREIVLLVSALIESNNLDEAQTRLDAEIEVDSATRADLQSKIETKKLMRQS